MCSTLLFFSFIIIPELILITFAFHSSIRTWLVYIPHSLYNFVAMKYSYTEELLKTLREITRLDTKKILRETYVASESYESELLLMYIC